MVCANGHASTERDYCSVCGTKIEGVPGAAAPAPPSSVSSSSSSPSGSASSSPGITCPNCSTSVAPDTRFCEVCGYDSTTGSLPQAPVVQSAAPPSTSSSAASTDPAGVHGTWVAVVTADRAYYDRNKVSEVQFPLGVPSRTIELQAGAAHAIGRRSRSRGTDPAIDLGGPPDDAAVSHIHASLLFGDDGTWQLVDHGSTNGTFVNESPDPVEPNLPRPLAPGDRIYLGAWTRITLELRPSP